MNKCVKLLIGIVVVLLITSNAAGHEIIGTWPMGVFLDDYLYYGQQPSGNYMVIGYNTDRKLNGVLAGPIVPGDQLQTTVIDYLQSVRDGLEIHMEWRYSVVRGRNLNGSGAYDPDEWWFDEEFGLWLSDVKGAAAAVDYYGTKVEPIPEPSTALLFIVGLIGFAGFRKKIRKP